MKKLRIVVPLLIVAVLVAFALAQEEEEEWAWVPAGGCTLLFEALEDCTTCDDIVSIVTSERTQEEWKEYFEGQESARENGDEDEEGEETGKGALRGFTEQQINTLLDYLAINMPVAKDELPEDPAEIDCSVLPVEGKKLTLQYCLSCHPMSVVAYEDRDLDGWMVLLEGRTHSQVLEANALTEKQIQELAHYLANNMPIPEEDIPEEHRGLPPGY